LFFSLSPHTPPLRSPPTRRRVPFSLEFGDLIRLLPRALPREHAVDAEFLTDGGGDRLGVPGEHDDLRALFVERVDRYAGFGADLIGEGERAGDRALDEHVVADRALL